LKVGRCVSNKSTKKNQRFFEICEVSTGRPQFLPHICNGWTLVSLRADLLSATANLPNQHLPVQMFGGDWRCGFKLPHGLCRAKKTTGHQQCARHCCFNSPTCTIGRAPDVPGGSLGGVCASCESSSNVSTTRVPFSFHPLPPINVHAPHIPSKTPTLLLMRSAMAEDLNTLCGGIKLDIQICVLDQTQS
jgi:hypothetical protein